MTKFRRLRICEQKHQFAYTEFFENIFMKILCGNNVNCKWWQKFISLQNLNSMSMVSIADSGVLPSRDKNRIESDHARSRFTLIQWKTIYFMKAKNKLNNWCDFPVQVHMCLAWAAGRVTRTRLRCTGPSYDSQSVNILPTSFGVHCTVYSWPYSVFLRMLDACCVCVWNAYAIAFALKLAVVYSRCVTSINIWTIAFVQLSAVPCTNEEICTQWRYICGNHIDPKSKTGWNMYSLLLFCVFVRLVDHQSMGRWHSSNLEITIRR